MGKRQSRQPSCGGCLLVIVLILLVVGGWKAVSSFVSFLFVLVIAVLLIGAAALFGFFSFMRKHAETLRQQAEAYERSENASHNHQTGSGAGLARAARQERRYCTVLGVAEHADFATIKKAYRQLSMQYHPDKVAHLGAEFKRVAEEKMKEINAAYDYFRKKFER